MKVRYHKAARDELNEAVRYYNRQKRGLGKEFQLEVQRGLTLVKQYPFGWQETFEGARKFVLNRFPYGLIYLIHKRQIVVVAIAQLQREPENWVGCIHQ